MNLRFLDLFAGIGGFRMGMERAGHKCAGYVEIDKHARRSYRAIFDTAGEWTAKDIRLVPESRIRDLGNIDCICGGFPCQPFSIAGKRAGFEDSRGNLFFEIARFTSILRPALLFLENVNGLLSHGGGVRRLEQSSPRWMNWGTMRNGRCLTAKISESPRIGSASTLSDILEKRVPKKYFPSKKVAGRLVVFQ